MLPLPNFTGKPNNKLKQNRVNKVTKEYIIKQAALLVNRFDSRDPEQIAGELGICIKRADIGSLRGMYTVLLGKPFIIISQSLDQMQSRQIIAHELGHHQLHPHFAGENILQETMLYDMASQPEYEANLFAAHLLIDDKAQKMAENGATFSEIAAALGIEQALAEIYFRHR